MALETVRTSYGQVRGVVEEDVVLFKGVPYAAPPVGRLRWRPPEDPAPWEGVRDCAAYGPRPVQPTLGGWSFEPWASDFYYMGFPPYSEDCLYLNIATCAQGPEEKRPVYMWFHGGGLSTGYSYEVEFNPTVLAKKGIVVVSVGQRLNVFGYLSLPQLSAEQGGVSGNYGLMDQVKALDWVRENIAAFGGDPDNITIGGQSGGTTKTGALARCPKAAGKVRRVINQSCLSWTGLYPTMSQAEAEGTAFLRSLGFPEDVSLEELRAADRERFNVPASHPVRKPGNMVFDGQWVPEQDAAVSFDQYAGRLDYLVGGNYGECVMSKGFELGGKTLGIIGFGRIGQALGRMAKGIGMEVIAQDIFHVPGIEEQIGMKYVELDELLERADFISLHTPSLNGVKLICKENIEKMKDGVVFINTSRGDNVNEADLLEALNSGKVRAAGLDVYADRRESAPRCLSR